MADAAARHAPATAEAADDRPAPGGEAVGPADGDESPAETETPDGDEADGDAADDSSGPDAASEPSGDEAGDDDPFAPADPEADPLGGVGTSMDGAVEDEDADGAANADADGGADADDPFAGMDDE
jgi:hypothetical protein